MIDRVTIDKITNAARIEEVVGDFVTLKRAGVNYKGLCPFHDDRTPSFIVSPSKNFCKCFACGEGGNPVNFIMKHEQLSYSMFSQKAMFGDGGNSQLSRNFFSLSGLNAFI